MVQSMNMRRSLLREIALYLGCIALPVISGFILEDLSHAIRETVIMVFLLEVLAVAALGRAGLAIGCSVAAAFTLSYNIFPPVGSFAVSDPENILALIIFVITAIGGSQLSLRAENRAKEANRLRIEMERLQRFSSSLLTADSVARAAEAITIHATEHFAIAGAELILRAQQPGGAEQRLTSGTRGDAVTVLSLDSEIDAELHLFGATMSQESEQALGNVVSLILDRAKGAEDRVRFESEQRSDELHTTVLNALAHNFRTPLTTIKIASSTLLKSYLYRKPGTSDDLRREQDLVEAIDEEADRLQTLIRESLQVSRLTPRHMEDTADTCELSEVVSGVVQKLSRYFPNERLVLRFDKDLPKLRGDRLLYEQMVFQVVDNAWKYSSPTARIWISAAVESTYLILTIQNEGVPVPDADKERIFERFARGAATRTKIEGTGLGLAIARTIVQSFGGRLWLENEAAGPAFRFKIPIME